VTLANLLGKRGWRVLAVDSARAVYPLPRAITADQEVMRVLQEIGVADEVLGVSALHPGADFLGVDGEVIRTFDPAPPPYFLSWPPSWQFHQPQLEEHLRAALLRFDNVVTRLGVTVVGAVSHADRVLVDLDAEGATETVEAAYVVGCDGARSSMRAVVQTTITDLGYDEWWVVVDANLLRPTEIPTRITQYCQPARPGTFIVGPGRLRRWEMKVLPGEDPQSFNDPAVLKAALSRFVDVDALEVLRVASYRFHAVVADKWREGRIFLAGDAAHQTPPFLGQGLCAGVRDAHSLAWKLDAVAFRGWDESLLDTYREERRPHVTEVVAFAKSFGEIIGELNIEAARDRDRRLLEERRAKGDMLRHQAIPDLASGLIARDSNGAGSIFPQPWVEMPEGPVVRLDEVLGTGFSIVGVGDGLTPVADRLADAATDLDASVLCVAPAAGDEGALVEQGRLLHDRARKLGATWFIVRPDRYVYATAVSEAEVLDHVAQLIAVRSGSGAYGPA
jgi:3-(3-hydroxy-phenyl)propionate hydroxylase